MKKSIKYIITILFIIAIIVIISIIKLTQNQEQIENSNVQQQIAKTNKTQEDVLIVDINKKNPTNEETEEPQKPTEEPEPVKDASTLTQEIYNMNSSIGTLYIPKTKITTEVYCNPDVGKMEKMPCFLYTNGGLNKKGTTLIVGHNRRNGKIFSNNKKLVEGDEFYFTDNEGNQMKYTITSKFITTESDTSFLDSDVYKPTIALSCCTDASDENRIIVIGRAD